MSFIGIEIILIVFARVVSVLLVQYVFVLLGAERSLKFKECVFLSYAGMIRGAIALGLAIKAEVFFNSAAIEYYDFVVINVLAIVILSTLIFGSFMPLVAKCLLDQPARAAKQHEHKNPNKKGGAVGVTDIDASFNEPALESPNFRGNDTQFSTPKEFHSLENKTTNEKEDFDIKMTGISNDLDSNNNSIVAPVATHQQKRAGSIHTNGETTAGLKDRLIDGGNGNAVSAPLGAGHKGKPQSVAGDGHDMKSVSSYSALLHPNEDPSEFDAAVEEEKPQMGRFKRMVAWIDKNWLKKLLVNKSLD